MRRLLPVVALISALAAPAAALAGNGRTITPGTQGAPVRDVQSSLVALGYLPASDLDGNYGEATTFAVEAFQKQEQLSRDGIAGPQTLKLLWQGHPARPKARYHSPGRHIEISLDRQLLYLVVNGVVRRTIAISSAGPGHITPRGRFSVYRKETLSWSIPYRSWMPYASYFIGGYAIHGYPEVPVYPASHGCVRVPEVFMREVYAFASFHTAVLIY